MRQRILEKREILGVLPSDNLKNSRYVLVVEGEDDRIALTKILPAYSEKIKMALRGNQLVIKALAGAGNLSHDLYDLKSSMCKFVVLLDNDKAGAEAYKKAKENGVLKESEVRFTICNGSPEAEFEDCLKVNVYADAIKRSLALMYWLVHLGETRNGQIELSIHFYLKECDGQMRWKRK